MADDIRDELARHYGDPSLRKDPALEQGRRDYEADRYRFPERREQRPRQVAERGDRWRAQNPAVSEPLAEELGDNLREGRGSSALGNLYEIILGAVPAVGAKGKAPSKSKAKAKAPAPEPEPPAPAVVPSNKERAAPQTLEEFVDYYSLPRGGHKPLFDYSVYLDPQKAIVPVGGVKRDAPATEPYFKRPPTQRALDLDSPQVLDNLRKWRDEGLVMGPNGVLVDPWYYNGPVFWALAREIGPEAAAAHLSRYADYNGPTSMETNVARNQWESMELNRRDIQSRGKPKHERDLAFADMVESDLTGKGFNNKKNFANQILKDKPWGGEGAHKIHSYSKGLKGNGPGEPFYDFEGTATPGTVLDPTADAPRILTPVVLDGIMAREMALKNKYGLPSKRFAGPMYGHGTKSIHSVGEEVGAGGMDTQAAIWRAAQYAMHKQDPTYLDSWARTQEDNIIRLAKLQGISPEEAWHNFAHGKGGPLPPLYKFDPLERKEGGEVERRPDDAGTRLSKELEQNYKLNERHFQPQLPPLMRRDIESSLDAADYLANPRGGVPQREVPLSTPEAEQYYWMFRKPPSLD